MDGDAGPGQLNSADIDGAERDRAVTASDDSATPDVDQPIDGAPSTDVKRRSLASVLRRNKTPSAASSDDVTPASVQLAKADDEAVPADGAVDDSPVAEPVAVDAGAADSEAAESDAGDAVGGSDTEESGADLGGVDVAGVDESTSVEPVAEPEDTSRLTTAWVVTIAAVLVLLAGLLATGGYFALDAHKHSVAVAQAEAKAVQAAKDCVAATQAPDPSAMLASQQQIYDCMTGDYAVQAGLMVGVLADAYQVAQAKVEIDNLRAAVEQILPDGTVQVLVAVQVKITNSQDTTTQGYRLRVFMQPSEDGTYKIGRLDQVSS